MSMPVPARQGSKAIPVIGIALAIAFLSSSRIEPPQLAASEEAAAALDTSRLVAIQHVVEGDACPLPEEWPAEPTEAPPAPAPHQAAFERTTPAPMTALPDGNLFAARRQRHRRTEAHPEDAAWRLHHRR